MEWLFALIRKIFGIKPKEQKEKKRSSEDIYPMW